MKNKGFTISELLCYIVIFSTLLLQISTFTIIVVKYQKNTKKNVLDEVLLIEDIVTDISDEILISNEELIISVFNTQTIEIVTKSNNRVIFKFDFLNNIIFNGTNGNYYTLKYINLEFKKLEKSLIIKTTNEYYHFIIRVS